MFYCEVGHDIGVVNNCNYKQLIADGAFATSLALCLAVVSA